MAELGEILEKLKMATGSSERNSLALLATETKNPSVLEVLIELIERPDLIDHRATLVNCVGKFNCQEHFLWLIRLVCEGNWEVSHEAYDILVEIDFVDSSDVKKGFDLLSQKFESGFKEEWRTILIKDLLSMFE